MLFFRAIFVYLFFQILNLFLKISAFFGGFFDEIISLGAFFSVTISDIDLLAYNINLEDFQYAPDMQNDTIGDFELIKSFFYYRFFYPEIFSGLDFSIHSPPNGLYNMETDLKVHYDYLMDNYDDFKDVLTGYYEGKDFELISFLYARSIKSHLIYDSSLPVFVAQASNLFAFNPEVNYFILYDMVYNFFTWFLGFDEFPADITLVTKSFFSNFYFSSFNFSISSSVFFYEFAGGIFSIFMFVYFFCSCIKSFSFNINYSDVSVFISKFYLFIFKFLGFDMPFIDNYKFFFKTYFGKFNLSNINKDVLVRFVNYFSVKNIIKKKVILNKKKK